MVGFVYSLPGIKHGKPAQWSHMLGVLDELRSEGVGRQLKMLQRDRTLAMELDLIEWTYDPMQALNAHLNFAKLGVSVGEYEENVYGQSTSPLHRGNPTDRFVAEWWIRQPRVEERLAGSLPMAPVLTVERANRPKPAGEWLEPGEVTLSLEPPPPFPPPFPSRFLTGVPHPPPWRGGGGRPPPPSSPLPPPPPPRVSPLKKSAEGNIFPSPGPGGGGENTPTATKTPQPPSYFPVKK